MEDLTEDLVHILKVCGSLAPTRQKLQNFTKKYCKQIKSPEIVNIIQEFTSLNHEYFCQFILDCSVLPPVIRAGQELGVDFVHHHLFKITRTWCYCLHRDRLKLKNEEKK